MSVATVSPRGSGADAASLRALREPVEPPGGDGANGTTPIATPAAGGGNGAVSPILVQLDAEARHHHHTDADKATQSSPSGSVTIKAPPTDTPGSLEEANSLLADLDDVEPSLVTEGSSVASHSYFGLPGASTVADAALVDVGGDRQLLYVTRRDGSADVFVVEDGVATAHLAAGESVDLGQGRQAVASADGGTATVRHGRDTVSMSADLARLTESTRLLSLFDRLVLPGIGVLPWQRFTREYSVETGQLIVRNGVPQLDAMTPAERYEFYSTRTPEGRELLEREGGNFNEPELFVARVRYLRGEGGAELFDAFTPRRAALSGEALEAHDAQVERVMDHLREIGVNTVEEESIGALDESMLYMLASATVEGYGGNPARIDSVIADVDGRWIVSIDNADGTELPNGGTSGGWYRRSESTVQLSLKSFINSYADPSDTYDILVHELAHSLDNTNDFFNILDGVPIDMAADDAAVLRAERERLFALAYPGTDVSDLRANRDTDEVVDDSGLGTYAFTNEREFLAEITELFLSSDANAARLAEISPELYGVLREYYGRTDLPPADATPPSGPDLPFPIPFPFPFPRPSPSVPV